jgi:hypothetical protein
MESFEKRSLVSSYLASPRQELGFRFSSSLLFVNFTYFLLSNILDFSITDNGVLHTQHFLNVIWWTTGANMKTVAVFGEWKTLLGHSMHILPQFLHQGP